MTSPTPAPLSDSPWFWFYLFGAAGLAGVLLLSHKFDSRQAGLDANFTRRQELLQQRAGKSPTAAPAVQNDEPRYVHFWLLNTLLALGTVGAWIVVWRRHFAYRSESPLAAPPKATTDKRTPDHDLAV